VHNLTKLAFAITTASIIAVSPMALHAEEANMSQQLSEARYKGSVMTAIATNRNLSPFSIDVDIQGDKAVLTGEVESEVDKDLAEQVALGIDGIEDVDNKLTVDPEAERREYAEGERSLTSRLGDATTTATIKSKLLWNESTQGLDIDVSTENGVVTLTGNAASAASKDLAEMLAEDTDDVREVQNELKVNGEEQSNVAERAEAEANNAENAISDAWITSKVKSSFLFSRNLSGTDISVKTTNGMVMLSGNVDTDAEKALAEETAKNIQGVNQVDADALSVEG